MLSITWWKFIFFSKESEFQNSVLYGMSVGDELMIYEQFQWYDYARNYSTYSENLEKITILEVNHRMKFTISLLLIIFMYKRA